MRGIKFRALKDDVSDCRFYYGDLVYDVNRVPRIYDLDTVHTCIKFTEGQYIGLRDKNGKDVYEGDIVLDNGSKVVVSYGLQEVDAFEGMGWNLWSHYGEKADGVRLSSSIEVIGNVWENPELLDEQ